VVNALRYGLRRSVNRPILALLAVFILSLAFGNPHPMLTFGFMVQGLLVPALPFASTQVMTWVVVDQDPHQGGQRFDIVGRRDGPGRADGPRRAADQTISREGARTMG
jgi:hypothetical protein